MNVVTAFLYGELQEKVYMEQPKGFIVGGKRDMVCHLTKGLNGLKQSLREWNKVIDKFFLETLKMNRNTADACVYIKRENVQILLVVLYVGDILIASSCLNLLAHTKHEMSNCFKRRISVNQK